MNPTDLFGHQCITASLCISNVLSNTFFPCIHWGTMNWIMYWNWTYLFSLASDKNWCLISEITVISITSECSRRCSETKSNNNNTSSNPVSLTQTSGRLQNLGILDQNLSTTGVCHSPTNGSDLVMKKWKNLGNFRPRRSILNVTTRYILFQKSFSSHQV